MNRHARRKHASESRRWRHIEADAMHEFGAHPLEVQAQKEAEAKGRNSWASPGWWAACGRFISRASRMKNPQWWQTGKWFDDPSMYRRFTHAELAAEYRRILPEVTCPACNAKLRERAEFEDAEAAAGRVAEALA